MPSLAVSSITSTEMERRISVISKEMEAENEKGFSSSRSMD